MIGTRITTRAATLALNSSAAEATTPVDPTGPTPVDLAAALVARFRASGKLGFTQMYRDRPGERAVLPYLVFTLDSGRTLRTDSDSYWSDRRLKLTAYAGDSDAANRLRDAAWAGFEGTDYEFADGFSIPLMQADQAEGKDGGRDKKNGEVYWASVTASARCRRDA